MITLYNKITLMEQYRAILNQRIQEKKNSIVALDMRSVKVRKQVHHYQRVLDSLTPRQLNEVTNRQRSLSNHSPSATKLDRKASTQDFKASIFISGLSNN